MIDSLAGSPVFIAMFLMLTSFLEFQSIADVRMKLQAEWWKTCVAAWNFWPVMHSISLSIVPVQLDLTLMSI